MFFVSFDRASYYQRKRYKHTLVTNLINNAL